MSRRGEWAAITAILLLAAALRFWALGVVPPGLCHDEVANWLIAHDILAGHHAIYFTAAYGHEPLYQYVQAATVALFGDHWLGLRWPSVAFGMLGLAVTYVLTRRLFGVPVALLTAAWLSMSFWPLFYARVGLRAIALPFTAALAAYFSLRAVEHGFQDINGSGMTNWLLAGLFLGLSLYIYMAARVLPFIVVAFTVYLSAVRFHRVRRLWRGILLMFAVAAFVSAPLVVWLATHPGAEYRIAEVREPLDRLLVGDLSLVWQNLIANLKFFTFAGDPWPRQNLPGRPVFADPISAVLFYTGLLIALLRWRDPRYGFLLLWLIGSLIPSIVTSVAPSSIRDILGLVVVFVFPAISLTEILHRLNWDLGLGTWGLVICHLSFVILTLASCLFLTVRDYFLRWPINSVVRFDYQTDLTAVAHRLDGLSPGTSVAVAGLSVHTMDGPSLELAARRDVHDVRLCDTRETLVVPAGRDARLFVPQVVPFDADLRERLLRWGAIAETAPSFTTYRLTDGAALYRDLPGLETMVALPDGTPVVLPVSFGGHLAFLGYERLGRVSPTDDSIILLTYWRVEEPPSMPLKIFVHLLGESAAPIAQHDGLGSPPHGWASGDLIVQKHIIHLPADLPPGQYPFQMGVYETATGVRLPVLTTDRLLLFLLMDQDDETTGEERDLDVS